MLCSYGTLVFMLVMVEVKVQLLTSSYSQVSRSGSARSHAGQTPWTHSSDVQIVRGQNLGRKKPNRRISVLKKKDKLVHFEDGTGEVIQERFNPRPWFAYETAGNSEPGASNMDLTVPFASFPLSLPNKDKDKTKPSILLKPPFDMNNKDKSPTSLNTYGSPYNSYNTNSGLDKSHSTKPPNNFVTPNNEYLPPSEHEPEPEPDPDYSVSNNSDDMDISPPSVPYKFSPDSDDIDDHEHSYNQDSSDITKLPAYIDHDPNIHGYNHDFSHHFPHDHPPIYYEVKTTTTEAPENQRLNKRPYSYYYIGRKLWYIPLYFSVYFIIYIFVLILKSIARHKITFNQYFEEDKRDMKDMHEEHEEHVHELEHHIFNDIMTAKRKYIM